MPRIKKTGLRVVPKSKDDRMRDTYKSKMEYLKELYPRDSGKRRKEIEKFLRGPLRKKFEGEIGKPAPKKPKTKKPPAKPKAPKKPKIIFKKRDLLYRGKSSTPKRKRSREV
mgnify:CR=1 FL=1